MFQRESFHYFTNAPNLPSTPHYRVSQDETYFLSLYHILNMDQRNGDFQLSSQGVTSIVSLQMRDKSRNEIRSALEGLYYEQSGLPLEHFSVLESRGTSDQPVFPYAVNAFSVYWKPTSKMVMVNFTIKHLMSMGLMNGQYLEGDLQIDTYVEEPDE